MQMPSRFICLAIMLGLSLAAGTAAGQAAPADPKAAGEALYERALKDLDEKRYAEACPKLEEVTRLLPEALGAKLTLAECYEQVGRLASAWKLYNQAAEISAAKKQNDREKKALRAAALLGPRLGRLRVVVPSAAAAPGLVVKLDDVVLELKDGKAALPLDAGAHELTLSAPGYQVERRKVTVTDGEETSVEDLRLSPIPEAAPVVVAPPPVAPPRAGDTGGNASRPVWPWVVGGVGVAAFGVGIGFVVDLGNTRAKLSDRCPNEKCYLGDDSLASVTSLGDRANRDMGLALGLGALGLGCLTAATVGLAAGKPRDSASILVPVAGPGFGGMTWQGVF